MKNRLLFSAILLVSLYAGGCKKESAQPVQATLSLSPSSAITYEAAGGSTVITVTTNQDFWKAVSDRDWCTVEKLNDTSFSVTAKPNEGSEPMPTAAVTVTAGKGDNTKTVTLTVNQRGVGQPVQNEPFTIEVNNISATSADMKVVPLHADATYYYNVISEVLLAEHSSDLSVYMANTVAEAVEIYGGMEEALRKITAAGIQQNSFTTLSPGTAYIAFAAGLDEKGTVNTGIISKKFTTEEAASEEVTFEIDFTDIYYDGMDFTLTPSDMNFTYYLAIRPAFQYDDLSDADLLEKIIYEDGLMMPFEPQSGIYEYTNDDEEEWRLSDTGYIVVVFGWDEGKPASDVHKFPFRTLPSTLPLSECTFETRGVGMTSRSAYVTVAPLDETAAFMWGLITEAVYEENKADMKQYVADYVAQNIAALDHCREMGEIAESIDYDLCPGTTYYVWAACIDEFGKPASEVSLSEPFSTLPNSLSSATVSAGTGK